MTRDKLIIQVAEAVKSQLDLGDGLPAIELEPSTEAKFGDYATNVAMVLAKPMGQSPRAIAEKLVPALEKISGVAKVEIAGPGFINMTMSPEYWAKVLSTGRSKTEKSLGKLQVEFISANPTGPMTLANARGGFAGDALAAVLSERGWEVEREFYLNDAGGQITKLADSVRAEQGIAIEGERQYQGDYVSELAEKAGTVQPASDFEQKLVKIVVEEYLKPAVSRLRIEFDTWFSERSLTDSGEAAKIIPLLKDKDLIEEREGAIWLLSRKIGDERDRVLIKASGEPTYLLGDLAYHYNIFKVRGFDRAIKLWGADHAGQVQSLKLGVNTFAPQAQIDFLLLQFVRLIRNGTEMKMSKRAGTYVTIDELLDMLEEGVGSEHAVNVARWFFLSRSADNRIDFDLDVAREESQKNPYFYVMYSYARASSLLAKAKVAGIIPVVPTAISNAYELEVVRLIAAIPDVLTEICRDYGIQRLPHAAYDLAKSFTALYELERIIDLAIPEASNRLYVVQCYIDSIEYYFKLMGIEPVQRMDSNS